MSACGKEMRACQVQLNNCDRCRYKCSWNISEEDHEKQFTQYWNLNTPERQRDFVCGTTTEYQTRTFWIMMVTRFQRNVKLQENTPSELKVKQCVSVKAFTLQPWI